MNRKSCLLSMLGLTLVFIGCSRPLSLESSRPQDAPRNPNFTRVLVIGLSPDSSVRCDFESFMATQLRSASVDAKASCSLMSTTESLTRENIEGIAAEYGADAVLTTVLVQSELFADEGGSRDTRGGGYYKATGSGYASDYYYGGGYGAYGIPVIYGEFQTAPVITTVEGEVSILSMLYATQDASLVYELTTNVRNIQSRDDAFATFSIAIADRLRRDNLIAE